MKSIIDPGKTCIFCGAAGEEHHLLFGLGVRELAEEDGIKIPCCRMHHTSGNLNNRIHDNPMAEKLSKILGQVFWEKNEVAKGSTEEEARVKFIARYGRSYY